MTRFKKGQTVRLNQYYAGIPIGSSGPVVSEATVCAFGGLGYYVEFVMYDVKGMKLVRSRWVPEKALDRKDFLEHLADQCAKEAQNEDLP